jgi:3-phytase
VHRRYVSATCAVVLTTATLIALGTTSTSAATTMLPADPARATVETAAWTGGPYTYDGGDVSDDSVIYANPTTPGDSVVIADNKSNGSGSSAGGIGVFSMSGTLLQYRQGDGMIGNVDLRTTNIFASGSKVLVGANRRDNSTMRFWILDPATKTLSAPVEVSTLSTPSLNYGFCMGVTSGGANLNAYVLHENGNMNQYRITESSTAGKVTATLQRTFDVGGQSEGCVVDDDNGYLYIGEEDVGIWRYGASSTAGSTRTKIASVGSNSLTADVEGLSIAKGGTASSGYLYASSQGNSRIFVFDRITGAFIKSFSVSGNTSGTIDAVTGTDGLDVSTENLGTGFPDGALVVHDTSNSGGSNSNLKYVPLAGTSVTPPSTTTVNVVASEDTYVDSAFASTNYGNGNTLSVDGASSLMVSYMKFDLTSYAGMTVESASLKVHTTTATNAGSPNTQEIRDVSDDSWTETGMTYTNRKAVGGVIGTLGSTAVNASYTRPLAVPNMQAQLGQQASIALDQTPQETDGLDLDSSEATTTANRPTLILVLSGTATSPPPPPTTTPPPATTTTNFVAVEDAYGDSSTPTTNYGSSAQVSVDGSPVTDAYMKFDLTDLAGKTLTSAQLRVHTTTSSTAGSPDSQSLTVLPTTANTWSEGTLTYNNRPGHGNSLGNLASGATSPNTTYTKTLSLTEMQAQLGGFSTITMYQVGSNGVDIDSSEVSTVANRPTLILTYEGDSTVPPPPPPAVTSAAERYNWGTPELSDQFNYTGAPNSTLWSVYNGPGHAGNGTRSPNQVTVNGSALRITGLSDGTTGGLATASALRGDTYGRYETRMRVSARDSEYHPVLIVWPDDGRISSNNCMEIDYAESTSDTTLMKFFLHYNCSSGQSTTSQTVDMTQWHNYAVEWTSTAVRGYIDGELWFTDVDLSHVPDWPAHQTIQLDWFPDGSSTTESWMEVDWWNYYLLN